MRILFTVTTEYHFLLTLSIVHEHFNSINNHITILLLDNGNNRLSAIVDKSEIPFIEIDRLKMDISGGIRYFIDKLLQNRFDRLFIFHEYHIVNSFIMARINTNCTIALGEDGTAIYQTISKAALPSRIRQTIKSIKESYRKGIFHFRIPFSSNLHGKSRRIEELWLSQPDLFKHNTAKNKVIRKINLLSTKEAVDFISQFFIVSEFKIPQNSLVYLGRVSYNPAYLEQEINFLKAYFNTSGLTHFYIKPHPLSTKEQVDSYLANLPVQMISLNIPAELLIASLNKCIVMAMDSTSLYLKNATCRNIVLYTKFQQLGVYPKWRHIPFPVFVQTFNGEN